MDDPCKHCTIADEKKYKYDRFKCEKPCGPAKSYQESEKRLMEIIRGKLPDIKW